MPGAGLLCQFLVLHRMGFDELSHSEIGDLPLILGNERIKRHRHNVSHGWCFHRFTQSFLNDAGNPGADMPGGCCCKPSTVTEVMLDPHW